MDDSQPVFDNSVVTPSSLPGVFWVAGARSGDIRRTMPFISLIETSHVPEISTPRFEDLDSESIPGPGGEELSATINPRDDTAVSSSDFSGILFDATLSLQDDLQLSLPWESGVMAAIFGDDTDSLFPSPCPPVEPGFSSAQSQVIQQHAEEALEQVNTSIIEREVDVPMYSLAIKVKPDRNFAAELDWLWQKALGKWLEVFEICGFPGVLGDALSGQLYASDDAAAGMVLRDALGVKSPRTSLKRAQTLIRYLRWLQQESDNWDPWSRKHCLDYIATPGPKGIVASRGTSLREALKFAHYVLDFQIPLALLDDSQIRGRAERLQAEADEAASARPLTADEVRRLEKMMELPICVTDKYLLGGILFAIFSRSRWSDLQFIDRMWLDQTEYNGEPFGFLEARTKFHKTSTGLAKKRRYMPLVCPVLGISGVQWIKHWLETFENFGVSLEQVPFGPVCRAPGTDGELCERGCTSDEITTFLNVLLKSESRATSHSLKHTTLSWSSSYGIDEQSRTLLGHHALPGSKALMVYSRDMLTRPLHLYCSMLVNIRRDHFRPDEARSSRIIDLMKIRSGAVEQKSVPDADVASLPSVPELPSLPEIVGDTFEAEKAQPELVTAEDGSQDQDANQEDDSSGVSSTDDSSSDSSNEQQAVDDPTRHIPGPVWQNKRSKVVHRVGRVEGSTACGRLISAKTFSFLEEGCSTIFARCGLCFKGEVISNVGDMTDALFWLSERRKRQCLRVSGKE